MDGLLKNFVYPLLQTSYFHTFRFFCGFFCSFLVFSGFGYQSCDESGFGVGVGLVGFSVYGSSSLGKGGLFRSAGLKSIGGY